MIIVGHFYGFYYFQKTEMHLHDYSFTYYVHPSG